MRQGWSARDGELYPAHDSLHGFRTCLFSLFVAVFSHQEIEGDQGCTNV